MQAGRAVQLVHSVNQAHEWARPKERSGKRRGTVISHWAPLGPVILAQGPGRRGWWGTEEGTCITSPVGHA
eukprot:1981185-Prymnesium_polylepis.1